MTRIPGNNNLSKLVTRMTKADALLPVIALEATVVAGRTYQAYKRGKGEEARERFLEEISGSIVWLFGVKALNNLGDKIIDRIIKAKGRSFDVGTDKILRRPFDNFVKDGASKKGISQTKLALLKGTKVISSVLIANLVIGFVVPKLNHYLTNTIRHKNKMQELEKAQAQNPSLDKELSTENNDINNGETTAFKGGGFAALNAFTNAIENTNTGKLLSTDIGVAGGRMINARTKEERTEIGFRDISSIYFYMWAAGHTRDLMNLIETGRFTRLNPNSAQILDRYLEKFIVSHGGKMSVEEFRKLVIGKKDSEIKLPEGMEFEKGKLSVTAKFANRFRSVKKEPLQVIKLEEAEKFFRDEQIINRLRQMSELQPKRLGESVLTKQQVIDAINVSEINNKDLLGEIFSEFTNGKIDPKTGKYINGDYIDPYKYVSNKKLYNLKKQVINYVEDICKAAKDGQVTKDLISKAKSKNMKYSLINFITGFGVSALFLSTIIPKIQYLITERKTGLNVFPGTYDFEHHKEFDA